MRKILTILILILITIFGASYLVENYLGEIDKIKIEKEEEEIRKKELKEIEDKKIEEKKKIEEISKESVENKINLLRKRFSLKGLIQKGDTYLKNEQHILALKTYLGALKQNPEDKQITKKIGDTYFQMNKFTIAYNYYKDLIGTEFVDSNKLSITYFYTLSKYKEKIDIKEVNNNIDTFGLNESDTFFYKTSTECLFNKIECQNKFEKYIKSGKGKDNIKIQFIKKAFDDYNAYNIKNQYYKDTYILSALFKARLYSITNILSKDILKEKSDYLPILKIIAKGKFELGDYKDSKKYLLEYNKINKEKGNPDDPKVNYMLGIINIELHEYILSNIYFVKALKTGHENISDISRRLIYNYYLAGNSEKMMLEFEKLIETKDKLNDIDYNLAIYYSIINGKNKQANKWTNEAMVLFPENGNFYGYKGWINKEAGDYQKAEYYLNKGLKLDSHNPLINLNLGIIEAKKGNLVKAKILLRNTIGEDPEGEFGKFATKELEEILLEREKIKNDIEENIN